MTPGELLKICDRSAVRPAAIAVASPATFNLLGNTVYQPGIPCELKKSFPALDSVLDSMMGMMGGGM